MNTTTATNRTSVTFTVTGEGNELILRENAIHAIAKKHNAQENIYGNCSSFKTNRIGETIGTQLGNAGGTITFHSHSCDHVTAANELVELLESFGLVNTKFQELIKTHRADGTAYKMPQTFIEAIV